MDAELAWRAVARALVLPPGGPLLLGVLGLALLRAWPRVGRALLATALALLLVLSLPLVGDLLSLAVEEYPPLGASQPVPVGAIVVLGGGVRRNGAAPGGAALTAASLERLAGGAALARRTGLPLVLSGGSVEAGAAEAEVMQAVLRRDFGLEARWLERRSRTTRENARETAALLAPLWIKNVVLVTSAVHMRRAVAEFEAAGVTVIPAPVGGTLTVGRGLGAWLPKAEALARSSDALYEVAGLLVARLGLER
ncbi:MAG TPA: YdcF family protein [Steroidobacteraceae bacterium]|nr:YdcF family protein [Steroidobacteraceae bacterium]